MSRAISMRHTVVPSGERDDFRARAREAQTHYSKSGCQYWLFEERDLPGAYVEFFEGPDEATLAKAHQKGKSVDVAARVYLEVGLT